jgi:hypothetical protein
MFYRVNNDVCTSFIVTTDCLGPLSTVLQAHVALDVPGLDKKVSQRNALISKLEHAIAIKNNNGIPREAKCLGWLTNNNELQVDLIDSYKKDLEQINLFISEAVEKHARRRRPKLPSKMAAMPSSRRLRSDDDDDSGKLFRFMGIGLRRGLSLSSGFQNHNAALMSSPFRKKRNSSSLTSETRSMLCDGSTSSSLIDEGETLPLKSSLHKHRDDSAASSTLDDYGNGMMKSLPAMQNDFTISSLVGEGESVPSRSSSLGQLCDNTGSSLACEDGNVLLESKPRKRQLGDANADIMVEDESMHTIVEDDSALKNDEVGLGSLAGEAESTSAQYDEDDPLSMSVPPDNAETMKQPAGPLAGIMKFLSTASSKAAHVSVSVASKAKNSAEDLTYSALHLLGKGEDGGNRDAAFVTFTSLRSVHTVIQNIQHANPFVLDIEPAPEPSAIFWDNVGKPVHQVQVGKLISILLTVALCLFWTIPGRSHEPSAYLCIGFLLTLPHPQLLWLFLSLRSSR